MLKISILSLTMASASVALFTFQTHMTVGKQDYTRMATRTSGSGGTLMDGLRMSNRISRSVKSMPGTGMGTWKRYCVRASPDMALCMSFTTDHRVSLLIMENWKAAVSDPGRRLSFRCIDQFRDILRMRCSNELMLVVDSDFIDNIPAIIESEFLNDAVTIRWNGAVFGDAVVALFEALSRKKLNTIRLESHGEPSKAFAAVLAKRLPKLKIISWALNAARRGE